MTSPLLDALFYDPDVTAVLSDDAFVSRMIEVEVALAKVQGGLAVIPGAAAERIVGEAPSLIPDFEAVADSFARHGVPVIDLVRQLREHVGAEAAPYVHFGATSQDIMDTALVLQLREALQLAAAQLDGVAAQMAELANRHRETLMVGRTRSQQALPITFGLKVATWLAPLLRHRERLSQLMPRLMVVQFGGGAGTLASLGTEAPAEQRALAEELALGTPAMPWHTQRDGLAELGGWLSLVTGSLGKMAQDVIGMAQTEVGEVSESDDPTRGGSSTMPQKRNPVYSEAIVSAARQNTALLTSMHHALLQQHERDGSAWQLEWLTLPQMVGLTGGALKNTAELLEQLHIHEDRMRTNVAASNGLLLAQAASQLLAKHVPPAEAKMTVSRAAQVARDSDRHLLDVLRQTVESPVDWSSIGDEASYLGATDQWINAVLDQLES